MTSVDISWSLNLRFSQYNLHSTIAVLKAIAVRLPYTHIDICSDDFGLQVLYFHLNYWAKNNSL